MSLENLHIVSMRDDQPCPITVDDLVNHSRAVAGWGYREVWGLSPNWEIAEIERLPESSRYSVYNTKLYLELGVMHNRWCKETDKHRDNHQTFLVAIKRSSGKYIQQLFFITFHDGQIWVALQGRRGDL
jgi:hypothetical protein